MNTDHLADTVASFIHSLPDKDFASWITNPRRTSFQFAHMLELDSVEAVIRYANWFEVSVIVARMGDGYELFAETCQAGYFYQFRMYPSVQTIIDLGLETAPPLNSPQGSRTFYNPSIIAHGMLALLDNRKGAKA